MEPDGSNFRSLSMGRRRGFTLIELLAVIAIIAIVSAIIFPVFSRVRAAAKQTGCVSNLSQVGKAILLYMVDYDDRFPQAVDAADKGRPEIWDWNPEWRARIEAMPMMHVVLEPYVKEQRAFRCPSDTGTAVLDSHPYLEFSHPNLYEAFGTSYMFRTGIAFRHLSHSGLNLPSDVNVMFDGAGHWHGSEPRLSIGDEPDDVMRKWKGYRYSVLYGDMRVESVTFDELQAAWDTDL